MRLHRALREVEGLNWHYAECASLEEFYTTAEALRPDVILANLHPSTLPWAANGVPFGDALTVAVFHEASQASVAALKVWPFDLLLCPDPTLLPRDPRAVPVPRFIPTPLEDLPPPPEVITVGSFGFGTPGKGFDRLCALVNQQFDVARIRINIPPHDDLAMVPEESLREIVEKCRQAVTKPGITLDITHEFFDDAGLLGFLAENTLNAFLYDDAPGRGVSSCTDYALAAGRPIAVSRTAMFRHLIGVNPSICVEDRSLAAITGTGTAALANHRAAYAENAAGAAWNAAILDALATRQIACAVPDGRGFNKLLDDRARAAYAEALADLAVLAPDMLARKIERANVQQAFALDTVRRLASSFATPRILAIGSFEDTAVASLRALGYRVEEIDPQVNGIDLEQYYCCSPGVGFDIVMCVSVLEHVPDDEAFVRQAAALLAPGGIAVFTVDFSERYLETGQRPAADQRLYTARDLHGRLLDQIPGYSLIDPPRWDEGDEDFEYEGCRYAFASWVFTRLPPAVARHAWAADEALGGPPWKTLLRSAEHRHAEKMQDIQRRHTEEMQAVGQQHAAEMNDLQHRFLTETEEFRRRHAEEMQAAGQQHAAEMNDLQHRFLTETEELGSQLAATSQRARIAEALLHDLRLNLRLPDPPIALRLMLPAARLIRRVRRTVLGTGPVTALPVPDLPGPVIVGTMAPAVAPPMPSVALAPQGFSLVRRGARLAYFTVRPMVRPVMHRVRAFMTGPQIDAIRNTGPQIDAIRNELRNELNTLRNELRNELNILRNELRNEIQQIGQQNSRQTDATRRLAAEMEAAILTLAMETQVPSSRPEP
jgi:SAM-dependent methyltransferase